MRGGERFLAPALILVLVAAGGPVRAALDGGTQSPFVLGASGRALAMGRTGATGSNDATSLFWNPAGLARLDRGEFSLFRSSLYIDGSSYHAGFLAYPTLDIGVFAIGYQRLDISGIEGRDDRNRLLDEFDSAESNLHLGFGRSLGRAVAAGLNLKLATQSIAEYNAVGIGCDVGLVGHHVIDRAALHEIRVGFNIQNLIEPTLKLDAVEVLDPRSLKLGAAYAGTSNAQSLRWAMAVDLDLPRLADSRAGIGAELSYLDALALRGGLDGGRLTLGFGLGYSAIRVNYAMFDAETLGRDDRFDVSVRFGRSATARRQERHQQRQEDVAHRLGELLERREREELLAARSRAELASTQSNWTTAAEHYRRALTIEPDDQTSVDGLARAERHAALEDAKRLLDSGDLARSAVAYQSILARWPDDQAATAALALARRRLSELEELEQQLDILFRDSLERFTRHEYAAAGLLLTELLRLSPEHELAATLLERAREEERAQAERRAPSAAGGNDPQTAERSPSATGATGATPTGQQPTSPVTASTKQARETSRERAQEPLSQARVRELAARYRRGLAEFESGDFEKAITLWRTVWIEDSGFEQVETYLVQAYLYQSVSLFAQGEYDAALGRCDRVLEIEPENAKALRYQERIMEEKREFSRIPRNDASR